MVSRVPMFSFKKIRLHPRILEPLFISVGFGRPGHGWSPSFCPQVYPDHASRVVDAARLKAQLGEHAAPPKHEPKMKSAA